MPKMTPAMWEVRQKELLIDLRKYVEMNDGADLYQRNLEKSAGDTFPSLKASDFHPAWSHLELIEILFAYIRIRNVHIGVVSNANAL